MSATDQLIADAALKLAEQMRQVTALGASIAQASAGLSVAEKALKVAQDAITTMKATQDTNKASIAALQDAMAKLAPDPVVNPLTAEVPSK